MVLALITREFPTEARMAALNSNSTVHDTACQLEEKKMIAAKEERDYQLKIKSMEHEHQLKIISMQHEHQLKIISMEHEHQSKIKSMDHEHQLKIISMEHEREALDIEAKAGKALAERASKEIELLRMKTWQGR